MAFTPPALDTLEPEPAPQPAATPVTHYSQGRSVGGPDESEDHWTNQGMTATGKNLTEGVVAVNPDVYPLGTVLKDADTGQPFLAADRHGNKDPNVVDIYQAPENYQRTSGTRRFVVAGKLDKVPDTVEGVRAALANFGQGQPQQPGGTAPASNDPSQSGYFEYVDPSGATVRRPVMAVRDEPVQPTETFRPPPQESLEADPAAPAFKPPGLDTAAATPGFLGNLWNSFAKGATSEGIYSGTEGAARALGTSLEVPDSEVIAKQPDGGYKMNLWKALAQGIGDTLTQYADDTHALREDLRAALPVDEKFAASYTGGIAQGVGQLAGQLPQFAIPGMAGVTALGTAYDQQYSDALEKGASPEQAHNAGLMGMPSGALDYLSDKLILGKILKPLEGKISLGDAVKHIIVSAAAEGTTEGVQQVWQNIVAKQLSGYDPKRPLTDQMVQSMIIGAVVGGGATGVGTAATSAMAPKSPATGRIEAVKVEGASPDAGAMKEAFGEGPAAPETTAPPAPSMMDRNAGWKPTTGAFTPPPVESIEPAAAPEPVAPRWKASDYEAERLAAQYRAEMEHEAATAGSETGHELLSAIDQLGGLPSKDSPHRAAWSGELDRVLSAARAKVDPKGGAFTGTLFRRTAPDLDQLRGDLADHGFKFDTESELIDAIEQRLTTGKKLYGNPAAAAGGMDIPFSKADRKSVVELIQQFRSEIAGRPLSQEQQGIHDVVTGDAKSTAIQKSDLKTLEEYVTLDAGNNRTGARHIITAHYSGLRGAVTAREVVDMGRVMRNATPEVNGDRHIYEWTSPEDVRFRVIVAPGREGQRVLTFYSNRKGPVGSHNATHLGTGQDEANASDPGVKFSKAPASPEHVQAINGRVESAVQKVFGNGRGPRPEVVVHPEAGAIPDNALRSAVHAEDSKGKGVVDAFLNPQDGKIHLIANRLNPDQVEAKVRHEGLHWALRTNEKFRNDYVDMLGHFAETLPVETLRDLRKLYGDEPTKLMEEYMARLAEAEPNSSAWRNFVVKVKALLARYFPNVKFSEADIRAFLHTGMQRRAAIEAKTAANDLAFSKTPEEEAATSNDPQAKRKFIESVKANANVRPEVKQRLKAEFYDPVSNAETVRQARAGIQAKGLDQSTTEILGKDAATWKPEAADYATALEVASELHKRGRLDDEAAIYDKMAIASTDQGRAIQFLSMMGRYSPEGIQIFAQRQIRAAVEADPELKRLYGEISRLRDELAEARKPAATQAVLDVQKILAEVLADKAARVRANLALRDALMQTWTDPAQAVATFKRLLEAVGVSTHNADRIAKRLANAAREHGKKNRTEVLTKIKTAGERRLPPGATERLLRLNREGKLDDATMHAELSKLAGVPVWTPEMAGRAKRLAGEYERATDPEVKLVLAARMLDTVRGMTPPSVWAKARGLQNLAMLLNPKTVIRNLGGNVVMWAGDLSADTLTNFAIDPMTSIFTGQRSRVTVNVRERFTGLAQPVHDFWNGYGHAQSEGRTHGQSIADGVQYMLDIARLTAAGKFELAKVDNGLRKTFSAPVLSHLEDTLGLVLGTTDRAFHASAYQASLSRQMALSAHNGAPVLAPTAEMQRTALLDAASAIYQNDTWLAKAAGHVRKGFNKMSTGSEEYGVGTAVLPFVQVPSSIALKAAEWSPAGFIRTSYEVFRPVFAKREFRQREFADAFSRATLGTAVWATGFWLAKLGLATALRDEDKDLAAMQDASGFGAYMLNVSALWRVMASGNWWTPQKPQAGDTLTSYNWISPMGVPLAAGAQYFQAEREQNMAEVRGQAVPNYAKYLSAVEGGGQAFLDQSFLSGLADAAKATGQNGLLDGSAQIAAGMPLNFIPTFVRQLRDYSDNTVRETSAGDFLQRTTAKLESSLPGESQKLPAKADLLGEAQERYQYATNSLFNVFLNPAFVRAYKADPELQEAERVYRATGERGVLPGRVEPTMQLGGATVRLTNEELAAYQTAFGKMGQNLMGRLLASPQWAAAPMPQKADAMADALRMAHNAAKLQTLGNQPQMVDRAKQGIRSEAAQTAELMNVR